MTSCLCIHTRNLLRAMTVSAMDRIAHGVGPTTILSVFSTATNVKAYS